MEGAGKEGRCVSAGVRGRGAWAYNCGMGRGEELEKTRAEDTPRALDPPPPPPPGAFHPWTYLQEAGARGVGTVQSHHLRISEQCQLPHVQWLGFCDCMALAAMCLLCFSFLALSPSRGTSSVL